jgi:nitroreductase
MTPIEALNWRYAVKKFSDERIPAFELQELLDATRLSPSSYGLQPYTVIVIESKQQRQRLLPLSFGQDKVVNSSHLIVFAAHTDIGDVTVDRYIDRYAQITSQSPGRPGRLCRAYEVGIGCHESRAKAGMGASAGLYCAG